MRVIPMLPLFFLISACGYEYAEESNLCGEITGPGHLSSDLAVTVSTVLSGHSACEGFGAYDTAFGDTGDDWWGETVAEPEADRGYFEATVAPGTYGVEVYDGSSDQAGCGSVDVVDESQCSGTVEVPLIEFLPVDKPNIYLYPEKTTDIDVRIPAWRLITESDPRYPVNGWRVRAWPDGALDTAAGPRDYLFYELRMRPESFQHEEGWCVDGALAQATLEDAMADLGFLPNEIADFSEAWDADFPVAEQMTLLPQLERLPALNIDPQPATLLRAWFVVTAGCTAERVPELPPRMIRDGYHAAEWGVAFEAPLTRDEIIVDGWR